MTSPDLGLRGPRRCGCGSGDRRRLNWTMEISFFAASTAQARGVCSGGPMDWAEAAQGECGGACEGGRDEVRGPNLCVRGRGCLEIDAAVQCE